MGYLEYEILVAIDMTALTVTKILHTSNQRHDHVTNIETIAWSCAFPPSSVASVGGVRDVPSGLHRPKVMMR